MPPVCLILGPDFQTISYVTGVAVRKSANTRTSESGHWHLFCFMMVTGAIARVSAIQSTGIATGRANGGKP
jgi:hypothetical protein